LQTVRLCIAGAVLLDGVGQLVSKQVTAFVCARGEAALTEHDVVSNGECAGVQSVCGYGSFGARVHADRGEIVPEARLEVRARGAVERLAGRFNPPVEFGPGMSERRGVRTGGSTSPTISGAPGDVSGGTVGFLLERVARRVHGQVGLHRGRGNELPNQRLIPEASLQMRGGMLSEARCAQRLYRCS
jgi:hypothetical protein